MFYFMSRETSLFSCLSNFEYYTGEITWPEYDELLFSLGLLRSVGKIFDWLQFGEYESS